MSLPTMDWKKQWGDRRFRTTVIALAVVLGLSGIGVGGYYLWPEPAPAPPPPPTATTQEAREYLAGDDFERLPVEQRVAWLDERRKGMEDMSPEQRRELFESMDESTRRRIGETMREAMRVRITKQVETYHSLPPEERKAFLDERIDEMEARGWRGRGFGPPRGPSGNRGGDRGPRPDRANAARGGNRSPQAGGSRDRSRDRRDWQSRFHSRRGGGGPGSRRFNIPADKRAEFRAYRKAMIARRIERGMGSPGRR